MMRSDGTKNEMVTASDAAKCQTVIETWDY
jgi:hypothetical protein